MLRNMADVDNRQPVFVKAVWRDGTKWVAGHVERNRGQHAETIPKEQFPGRVDVVDGLTHLRSVPQRGVGGHNQSPHPDFTRPRNRVIRPSAFASAMPSGPLNCSFLPSAMVRLTMSGPSNRINEIRERLTIRSPI